MSRIASCFAALKSQQRQALIPYITAGDPHPNATLGMMHALVAGGADIILLPEVPYDIQVVCDAITKRTKAGKRFSILAVAEGVISKEDAAMSKKELKEKREDWSMQTTEAV